MAPSPRVLLLAPVGRQLGVEDDDVIDAQQVTDLPATTLAGVQVVVLRSGPRLGARELELLPALRTVVRAGNGVDNIDVDELRRRGIELRRNPDASAGAVGELALAALLALTRRVVQGHRLAIDGAWAKSELVGEPVGELRAAVWGSGPIGRACADAFRPLVRDLAYIDHASVPPGFPRITAADALARCDVHVLALPLRETTLRIVDRQWLEACAIRRPYVLNLGRMDLLDVPAVLDALRRNELRGVHIDPIDEHHLATLRDQASDPRLNLVVTQHQGAQRRDVRVALDDWVWREVTRSLAGDGTTSQEGRP